MSAHWLTFQSFQQGQDLLEAINLVSIHTKLQRNGMAGTEHAEPIQQSREKIKAFLQALATLVHQAETKPDQPLLGIDIRRQQLVDRFLDAKRNPRRFRSTLFKKSIEEAIQLLTAESEEERHQLINSLSELRALIEEHIDRDTVRILGEF
jgi:hypothetical protein